MEAQIRYIVNALRIEDGSKNDSYVELGLIDSKISFFIDSEVSEGSLGKYSAPVSLSLEDAKKAHVELGKLIAELEG